MELNNLQISPGSKKKRKRVGRGNSSGQGTTAGRGTKGQKSRSGAKTRRGFEGGQMPLYRRIPKRGFNNINRKEYAVVNVQDLESNFEEGDVVNPQELIKRRLVSKVLCGIKILGEGNLSKKLSVKAHRFSKSAADKIRAVNGTVEELK